MSTESIDISVAEDGRQGEVRHHGVIPGDVEAVAKVLRVLRVTSAPCTLCMKRARAGLGSTGA